MGFSAEIQKSMVEDAGHGGGSMPDHIVAGLNQSRIA